MPLLSLTVISRQSYVYEEHKKYWFLRARIAIGKPLGWSNSETSVALYLCVEKIRSAEYLHLHQFDAGIAYINDIELIIINNDGFFLFGNGLVCVDDIAAQGF